MSTKAQMQMTEIVVVIFIVIGLFVLGVIFYSVNLQSSISKSQLEERDLRSNVILNRVLNLPELQCTRQNIVDSNCLDNSKVKAFKNTLETNNEILKYYSGVFGRSRISLRVIYPNEGEEIEIFVFDESESKIVKEVPVLIKYSEGNEIALLRVEVFE